MEPVVIPDWVAQLIGRLLLQAEHQRLSEIAALHDAVQSAHGLTVVPPPPPPTEAEAVTATDA